ncbi:hypothetical protein ACWEOH_08345 [Agromyces sp. NPDC004153]
MASNFRSFEVGTIHPAWGLADDRLETVPTPARQLSARAGSFGNREGFAYIPKVKLTFTTPDEDVVSVEISAYEVSKRVDEMIISLKTALPKIPRRR